MKVVKNLVITKTWTILFVIITFSVNEDRRWLINPNRQFDKKKHYCVHHYIKQIQLLQKWYKISWYITSYGISSLNCYTTLLYQYAGKAIAVCQLVRVLQRSFLRMFLYSCILFFALLSVILLSYILPSRIILLSNIFVEEGIYFLFLLLTFSHYMTMEFYFAPSVSCSCSFTPSLSLIEMFLILSVRVPSITAPRTLFSIDWRDDSVLVVCCRVTASNRIIAFEIVW